MKTSSSTDADQAAFLLILLRRRGMSIGREYDELGREWLTLSGAMRTPGDAELFHQAAEFHVELLAILETEDAARSDASRPKPRKR